MPQTVLATSTVICATCKVAVSVNEVFDAWELAAARDTCPRCQGLLLSVVALS